MVCEAAKVLLTVVIVPQFVHSGLVDMTHPLDNNTVVVPEWTSRVQFMVQQRGYWAGVLPDVW